MTALQNVRDNEGTRESRTHSLNKIKLQILWKFSGCNEEGLFWDVLIMTVLVESEDTLFNTCGNVKRNPCDFGTNALFWTGKCYHGPIEHPRTLK